MKRKTPFWATIFTLLGVLILCGLGSWQVQRLAWKTEILAGLAAAYESGGTEPIDEAALAETGFAYGRVAGAFQPDKAILIGPRVYKKQIGKDLIVPVTVAGERSVLVNLGWTAYPLDELPIYHLDGQEVWFTGLARTPRWNSFTPKNEPKENLWYRGDIDEIATAKNIQNPAPYMLYAEGASHKFDAQFPRNERWNPPNDHLQYAIFWFAMAGTLIAVYALRFLKKRN